MVSRETVWFLIGWQHHRQPMRNQIVSRGNQCIMVRSKGTLVGRHWFRLDYFHQYLETIDGVLVQLFLSSSFDHNIMLLHLIIGINSILSKLQCMSRPSPGSDQFPVVTRSGPAPDISRTAHLKYKKRKILKEDKCKKTRKNCAWCPGHHLTVSHSICQE